MPSRAAWGIETWPATKPSISARRERGCPKVRAHSTQNSQTALSCAAGGSPRGATANRAPPSGLHGSRPAATARESSATSLPIRTAGGASCRHRERKRAAFGRQPRPSLIDGDRHGAVTNAAATRFVRRRPFFALAIRLISTRINWSASTIHDVECGDVQVGPSAPPGALVIWPPRRHHTPLAPETPPEIEARFEHPSTGREPQRFAVRDLHKRSRVRYRSPGQQRFGASANHAAACAVRDRSPKRCG